MHGLTRLRFWLALWVVLFHFRPSDGSLPGVVMRVFEAGYLGVPFFFVLSGFVLAAAYSRSLMQAPGGGRRFALRRFARLYPAFAAAVLAFALLQVANLYIGLPAEFDAKEELPAFPLTMVGLHAWIPETACAWNCPSWSLSVEFAFYVAFPLLVRLSPAGRTWAFAGATLYAATMLVGDFGLPREFFMYHPTMSAASFILGMMLWDWGLHREPKARQVAAMVALPAVASLVVLNAAFDEHPALNGIGAWFAVCPTIVALARSSPADDPSFHTLLGSASYSLYIWHIPMLLALQGAGGILGVDTQTSPFAAVGVLFVVAASILLYKGWEVPAERWVLRSLGGPRPQPGPAAVPP